jgi:predicted transposase/invertase (TIGR01784 family)
MNFVDVKNDIAFRKIFGNENRTESLISFLNAILDWEGDQRIASVQILNPYQLPNLRGGKVTIIDVRATDQIGRTYLVEMQVADVDGFGKRVLYYFAKSYSDQIQRGEFYRELKPIIFIGILDYVQTQNPNVISRHQVRDVETHEQTLHDVEFTFVELPKFTKSASEVETLTDKWIYFLKNAENIDVVPENVDDAGLQSAYQQASMHAWTRAELAAYDYASMREEDDRAKADARVKKALKQATEAAEAKGIEKGIEKGKIETTLEVATNLKHEGVPPSIIAKTTGLSLEEIERL